MNTPAATSRGAALSVFGVATLFGSALLVMARSSSPRRSGTSASSFLVVTARHEQCSARTAFTSLSPLAKTRSLGCNFGATDASDLVRFLAINFSSVFLSVPVLPAANPSGQPDANAAQKIGQTRAQYDATIVIGNIWGHLHTEPS